MPSIDEVEDKIIADAITGMADDKKMMFKTEYFGKRKNAWVTFVLNFFLGQLGIHLFYLGNTKKAIVHLVLSFVGIIFAYIAAYQLALTAMSGLNELSVGDLEGSVTSMMGNLSPGTIAMLAIAYICLGIVCIMTLIDLFTFIKNTKIANEKIAISIKARI